MVINKAIIPKQPKRRGRKGYGAVLIVRLLVYSVLVGIFSNRGLRTHLGKQEGKIAKALGFKTVPHRTTISRWRRKHTLVFQALNCVGNLVQLIILTVMELVDSTEIEDSDDPDARKGKTSKGWFEGFKLHTGINQLRVPVRAVFTTGNKHDSPILPDLLVACLCLLGDAGYDSKDNREKVRDVGGLPLIDRNPRTQGKSTRDRGY